MCAGAFADRVCRNYGFGAKIESYFEQSASPDLFDTKIPYGCDWEVWGMSLCLFIARDAYQLFSIGPPARLQGLHQRGNPTVIVVEGYFLRAVELNPFL